jgi:hypothetical protein
MGYEPAVFNQLFSFIPRQTFRKSAGGGHHRGYLQTTPADRTLLQVDQAEPEDRNVSRRLKECGHGANPDGHDL